MDAGPRPRVVFVVGPTAVGKSAAAVRVAEAVGGEVVSADSMQVYRGMDVGTAKPSAEDRDRVPHHLIDIIAPYEPYNVADFHRDATAAIDDILSRGRAPFVVGGSGLYVRAIANKLDLPVAEPDEDLRRSLKELAHHSGVEAVHARLKKLDPVAAERIHPNDVKKAIRAIEVCMKTGRPMSEVYESKPEPTDRYECLMFGLICPRDALYMRVEERCDQMINSGLPAEVRALLSAGCTRDLQSMQAIGYKEFAAHHAGEISFPEAVETFKRNTRRYVKRQETWFRAESRIEWVDVLETDPVVRILESLNRGSGVKPW